ncbi:MAG: DUF2281 domain-containing protein [Cyanobacteria bacterium P01_F01_bin.150]
MMSLEQIQQDIQELPDEAQLLLLDFIGILKKRYPKPQKETLSSNDSPYQTFKASSFIGLES